MRRGLAERRSRTAGPLRPFARLAARVKPMRFWGGAVIAVLLSASPLGIVPALAQADLIEKSFGSIDNNQPLLLQADNLIYDRKNDRVIAEGDVEVYYNDYSLVADELIYDQRAGTLEAVGNVRIKEPDGAVVKADRINLTEDFRDGFVRSLSIVTADDERIAARRGYREGGEKTIFEDGAYTPCQPCRDDQDAPLWQINARKIIHDKSEGNVYYEDATLEFLGWPIAYVPYFYHPDPTVKRRSGFLVPKITQSDNLGFMYEQPYYYAIAPNKDLVVAPIVTTDAGFLLKADWRHRLESGQYRVQLAGVHEDDPDIKAPTDSDFRGTIETQGSFQIGSFWNWGWDITADTDDTFRRFYKIDGLTETERTSEIFLVGQSDRNYFSARGYSFVDLTRPDQDMVVHPVIDYNSIADTPVLGGELGWDTNVVALSREDGGPEAQRLTTEVKWRRALTDGIGQRVTPFAAARADFFNFTSFEEPDPVAPSSVPGDTLTRQLLTGGVDYRFPFVKHTEGSSHVVEPIVQVIARADQGDATTPANDSRSLVFDDTLLFDIDKFSGYDRLETGTRLNYGMQYTLQSHYGFSMRTVFGQSHHLAGTNPFDAGSGLEDDASDYVAGMYVDVPSMFRFVAQTRIAEGSYDVRRLDLQGSAAYGPVRGAVNYVRADSQPGLGVFDDREEVFGSGAVQLTDVWALYGGMRYDIEHDEVIEQSLGVKYSDCDCFIMSVEYKRSEIEYKDIEPETSVLFAFQFKHLGGAAVKTDMTDGFSASVSGK